ncbi:MAG: response regulator transcription factor [Anaerolineae bacterium]
MATRCVLVIEADAPMANVLRLGLCKIDLEVHLVRSGGEALDYLAQGRTDLVILDVVLPDIEAAEMCRKSKQVYGASVLVITSLTSEMDILNLFGAGADDVLRKPFGMREFTARTTALLRRSATTPHGETRPSVLSNRELRLDLTRHSATRGLQPLRLTPTEFRLLAYFMRNPGRTIPHRELLTEIWGSDYANEKSYLQYYVRFLRQKLGDDPAHPKFIFTSRGKGYRFGDVQDR